jgi:FlaA1/EpsC-like NDP-sugar epimerase
VISCLESIDWHRFLARPGLLPPTGQVLDALRNERILVTGAGGSIGSALAERLAALSPQELVLLDSSESRLFALQARLVSPGRSRLYLGSVIDSALLDEIFAIHAPRLIFHAAAFKHVPLLEEHPFAAIKNNIFATKTLVSASNAHSARIILLSSDKAVAPASVMGATKRIAEHVVLEAGGTTLRLGNVLASSGSVAEVFARRITAGGTLTVTHPAARRYFLTLSEAVHLLLSASAKLEPPYLLAPALPAQHFIADLARFMAHEFAPGSEFPIEFTFPRPGDKEAEQLWSSAETASAPTSDGLLSIRSPLIAGDRLHRRLSALRSALEARDLLPALEILCSLVPDFTPSTTVLTLARQRSPRVSR